jgi:hypothetical protein
MTAFVAFALTTQVVLVVFFATYLWRPGLGIVLGRFVYGLGIVAALLAVVLAVVGEPWYLVLALVLYAAWSAYGAWIDIVQPVGWRVPPRWSILVPYVILLTAALFALWIPLWYVDSRLWLAYTVLYATHTTLNISAHLGAGRKGPRPT